MDMRQGSRWGCGLALLICLGLVSLVLYQRFSRSIGPEEEADRFLTLLAKGKANSAYAEGARSLRSGKTAGMLTLEAQQLGLNSYAHSAWSEVRVGNREATLEGTVTTKGGEVIPLIVRLVREDDQWRVRSITPSPSEASSDQESGLVPPDNP